MFESHIMHSIKETDYDNVEAFIRTFQSLYKWPVIELGYDLMSKSRAYLIAKFLKINKYFLTLIKTLFQIIISL